MEDVEEEEEDVEDVEEDVDEDDVDDEEDNDDSGSVGVIQSMTLRNFMTHKHFYIDFGPRVTFITGQNGSGKSAILLGLTLGLGGSAKFTLRGKKLSDFVNYDESARHAIISITLSNSGPEAYRPDEFGPSIIVERKITKDSGASSYKLKSSRGKLISKHKLDLDLMREQFNIQIDNPCAILMQETSREFLKSAKPSNTYEFFLKATQLEQMWIDFSQGLDKLSLSKKVLESKIAIMGDMHSRVKELKEEYNDIQELANLHDKKRDVENRLVWAHVGEKEAFINRAASKLAKNAMATSNTRAKLESVSEQLSLVDKESVDIKERMNGITDELRANEVALRSAKKDYASTKQSLKVAKELIRKFKRKIVGEENRKRTVLAEMEQVQLDSQAQEDEGKREIEREIAKKMEVREQLHAEETLLLGELDHLSSTAHQEATNAYRKASEDAQAAMRKVRDCTRIIDELRHRESSRASVYGKSMPGLLNAIKRERWNREPIGPIGLEISLRDASWQLAVELAISNRVLASFIVDNHADDKKLKALMKRHRANAPTIIQRFRDTVYELTGAQPPPTMNTVLSAIACENPMVVNALIDQREIEHKILLESEEEANQIMFKRRPAWAKEAILGNGTRIYMRGRMSEHTVTPPNDHVSKLSSDVDALISQHQARLRRLEQAFADAQAAEDRAKRAKGSVDRRVRELRSQLHKLGKKKAQVDADLEELQESLAQDAAADAAEILREKQELVDTYTENIEAYRRDLEAREREVPEIEPRLETLEADVNALDVEFARLHQESKKAQLALRKHQKKASKLEGVKSQHAARLESHETKRLYIEVEMDQATRELEADTEAALAVCERIQVDQSVAEVEKELHNVAKLVQREAQDRRDPAVVVREYQNAKAKFRETTARVKRLRATLAHLERNIDERYEKWVKFRHSISHRTNLYFNTYMAKRNYSGSLDFDHENRTLNIEVALNKTGAARMRSTRTLSGGETSYSTVSLLLSLWNTMECPFRAMDEFDVFMDSVNRKMSMDLLLDCSRQMGDKQFIFITPHSTSGIPRSRDVVIKRLKPPRGAQREIDEMLQATSS